MVERERAVPGNDTICAVATPPGAGGIGIVRMPTFFTRIHAAGMAETMGAPPIRNTCAKPDNRTAANTGSMLDSGCAESSQ